MTLNLCISFTRIPFTMLTCWLCQRQAFILFTDNKLDTRHQNDGHNGKKDHVKDKRKIVLVHYDEHVRLRFTKITNTILTLTRNKRILSKIFRIFAQIIANTEDATAIKSIIARSRRILKVWCSDYCQLFLA